MMKFKYDFRTVYTPATSISNTLTTGSTGLTEATTFIQNKKYIDVTATIMSITGATNENLKVNNADGYSIGATSILFDNGGGSSVVDAGDYVKILNYWYLVDSVSWSVAGTSGTINLHSGLLEAIEDDTFIYVKYPINIVFQNCLFVNCEKIFLANNEFGTATFQNCTFYNCKFIVDTTVLNSGIDFTSSIIFNCLFLLTDCQITIDKSCYNDFVGYTQLTITNSIKDNPLFRDDNCVLMSKSRGDLFDSPCLEELRTAESWTVDAGCWTETRGTALSTNSELFIERVCDIFSKTLNLTSFKKFINESGRVIQYWKYGEEKTTLILSWKTNTLSNDEMEDLLDMIQSKTDYIEFYPDKDDTSKYATGYFLKKDEINIKKLKELFYELNPDKTKALGYNGIVITIIVDTLEGTWQP